MSPVENVRVLDDTQVEAFDKEYVYDERWNLMRGCIEKDFPKGDFRLLDIGGGNGVFADRVLAAYPNATAVVLDLSQMLLDRNRPNPRKTLVHGSATDLAGRVEESSSFDIICCNWLLHHLVGDSYAACNSHQRGLLQEVRRLLSPRGRVSVWENMYDGLVIDGAPGRIIYELTSLRRIAPLIRKLGANTAGVGVCFQSKRQWEGHFASAGLKVDHFVRAGTFRSSRGPSLKRWALHARPIGPAYFWLSPVA
jgi:ubiquinone/menaquinone biosynthesis C-methylase UbiE